MTPGTTEAPVAAQEDGSRGEAGSPVSAEAHAWSIEVARLCAAAADAKKAEDVVALDVCAVSDVSCAIVVCTAANPRLADAVVDEVEERVRERFGLSPLSVEGRGDGRWILVDFGSVVVHVFSPEGRAFYRIERLWGDAPTISLGLS